VVGSHGAGGAHRWLLGSVSRQLTERPTQAVAIVPNTELEPGGGVFIVEVDGSAGSSRALRWAGRSARRSGADIVVIHADEPPVADLSRAVLNSVATGARQMPLCSPLPERLVELHGDQDGGGDGDDA
jgi:nucleotide-binding universal stress UspA family protein